MKTLAETALEYIYILDGQISKAIGENNNKYFSKTTMDTILRQAQCISREAQGYFTAMKTLQSDCDDAAKDATCQGSE